MLHPGLDCLRLARTEVRRVTYSPFHLSFLVCQMRVIMPTSQHGEARRGFSGEGALE